MPFALSDIPDLTLHQCLGLIGFCIYVLNYCCLSFRILSSESALFFAINTTAACLVLISLTQDFNLASALIQVFWIGIGACAVVLRLWRGWRLRRAARRPIPLHHGAPAPSAPRALRRVA